MKTKCFYIKDFYYIKSPEEVDVSFIPPLIRRKLSTLDKLTLTTMNRVFTDEVEEIIFSSQHGETDRLNTIISQYQEMNEVSPTQFSASVHNYPIGFFTLFKKVNIPYYALSAGENSFSVGLTKSVISTKENTLFTYTDDVSISCIISKKEGKIKCNLNQISKSADGFINFLEESKK